ncbi:MAG: hypothetical protein ABGX42_03200 [Gammaproteobacteria bacterium]|jgi:heme/copper-type cytochrome/quinol oxidase subunit 2
MGLLELLFKFLMMGVFVSVYYAFLKGMTRDSDGFMSEFKKGLELLKVIFPILAVVFIALFFLEGVREFLGFGSGGSSSIKVTDCTYYRGDCLP